MRLDAEIFQSKHIFFSRRLSPPTTTANRGHIRPLSFPLQHLDDFLPPKRKV